jgi:CBS domain-containing protein
MAGAASARVILCLDADAPVGVARRAVGAGRWLAYPVVDARGVLVGATPMSALSAAELPESLLPVTDVMVPAIAVRESDPLVDAIGAMTSHHLRQVPIVDAAGRVTGVLSDLAVLRWVARGAPARWR